MEAIKPGGPCDGVGISIGDAIRYIEDFRVERTAPYTPRLSLRSSPRLS